MIGYVAVNYVFLASENSKNWVSARLSVSSHLNLRPFDKALREDSNGTNIIMIGARLIEVILAVVFRRRPIREVQLIYT